jgi:ABC-type multidrug transport system fused ATPase/permease subunit
MEKTPLISPSDVLLREEREEREERVMMAVESGMTLELRDVSFFVKSKSEKKWWGSEGDEKVKDKKEKQILYDVNCEMKPGTLTAIMGPSGAGKSMFLSFSLHFMITQT